MLLIQTTQKYNCYTTFFFHNSDRLRKYSRFFSQLEEKKKMQELKILKSETYKSQQRIQGKWLAMVGVNFVSNYEKLQNQRVLSTIYKHKLTNN